MWQDRDDGAGTLTIGPRIVKAWTRCCSGLRPRGLCPARRRARCRLHCVCAALSFDRPRGRSGRRSNPSLRGRPWGHRRVLPFSRRPAADGARPTRSAGRRCGVSGRTQPNRLRREALGGGRSRPAVVEAAAGGHAAVESAGVSAQPVPLPGQALPGRSAEAWQPQRPRARCTTDPRRLSRPAPGLAGPERRDAGSSPCLSLADDRRRQFRGAGCLLCDGASSAATVGGEGGCGDSAPDERQGLPDASRVGTDGSRNTGVAVGLCAGVALRLGWQFCHATLGATPVSRGGSAGACVAGHAMP